jgi:hypothetical protein
MKRSLLLILPLILFLVSCGSGGSKKQQPAEDMSNAKDSVRLVTVDPGHFHAALVQKIMYPEVSPNVYVYAPEGPDLKQHLARIDAFNKRTENPTKWNEIVYTGPDFFDKMIADKKGNVVVLSGNNQKKADYISRSVSAGMNVLADKPMIIRPEDFPKLEESFRVAKEKGVLLYDIMTERFEITTIMQKMLSQKEEIFGKLTPGTKDNPSVSKVSVHHYAKLVSGVPLQSPAWYYDVEQQGEGIVDVTTHLVDLVQWECFPEQALSTSDIQMVAARRWPTIITLEQFKNNTGVELFPDYLQKDIKNGKLNVYANGEMIYQIKGVFAKVSVEWRYMAPPGTGDTHYSLMRGSQCDLVIKQGADEKYLPTLYVENIRGIAFNEFQTKLKSVLSSLPYDSIQAEPSGKKSFRINIPKKYKVTHEDHFSQVTAKYLKFLREGNMPEWEVPNMITKYYTTTSALKMARENK